jgi:hypothetical protein
VPGKSGLKEIGRKMIVKGRWKTQMIELSGWFWG